MLSWILEIVFNKIWKLDLNYKKSCENLGADLTIKYANVKWKMICYIKKKKKKTKREYSCLVKNLDNSRTCSFLYMKYLIHPITTTYCFWFKFLLMSSVKIFWFLLKIPFHSKSYIGDTKDFHLSSIKIIQTTPSSSIIIGNLVLMILKSNSF